MAIHFMTSKGQALLDAFDARIQQKEAKGKITTWQIRDLVDRGRFYTHLGTQWKMKAWLKAKVSSDRLTFNIIAPEG